MKAEEIFSFLYLFHWRNKSHATELFSNICIEQWTFTLSLVLNLNLKSFFLTISLHFWFLRFNHVVPICAFCTALTHSSQLVGWSLEVPSRAIFLSSHCLVTLCGVYVCSLRFCFRRRINSPRGSVHVLVLSCFFSKAAFHLYCQIKGRKPQIIIWMVGKDLSHAGNALGDRHASFITGEKRVKDCTIWTVCGLTVLGTFYSSSPCAALFVIVTVGKN